MHDEVKLTYIGLTDLEVRVLKSIFTLAPQLNENFILTSPEFIGEADVILVNADNPENIREWQNITAINNLTSSLMLTDKGETNLGDLTIQRPIRIQKLISALEDVVEQTSIDIGEPDSINEICVMVVDDSFPVRKFMEHKLNELIKTPIKLHLAASGEEAIRKLEQIDCEIIFLDVMMEGIDGYKVCKTIKAKDNPYVVMLTSKKSPFDKVRGTMSGCDAYITKPPSDEKLIDAVNKYAENRVINPGKIAMAASG
ncbi:MAG: response regulator [Gammaproteobacteria bacterium]|nr:response regulator [Gammaproteobacteria bacterium]